LGEGLLEGGGPAAPEVVGEAVGLQRVGGLGRRRWLLLVAPPRVLLEQIAEEPHRAGPVGERVEDLQGDPPTMVDHPEQQGASARLVDRGAGGTALGLDDGTQIAVLQVVPEHSPAQHRVVERVALEHRVERLLEQLRVHLGIHLGAEAEHLGVRLGARGEEDVRGVVQPHPGPAGHAGVVRSRNASIS
jgi:hypothetical protein